MRSVCTIVNLDYISQAAVLFDSLNATNTDLNYYVLLIDGREEPLEILPGVITIHPNQLNLSERTFLEMSAYYDVIELATSLKPFLLSYLLGLGSSSVVYLDPDVQVFSSLEKVFRYTEECGTTITPHRLTPTSGANPGFHELGFLRYGVYNLGYIGVTSSSIRMLDWWSHRLVRYSGRFPEENIFTDQKWIDLARSYFDLHVIKDPTLNIAPWNLDERTLHYLDGTLMCEDSAVVFVHFSQLSSSLSKGIFLPYWELTMDGSIENLRSLEIIKGVTRNYSELLQSARKRNIQYPGKVSPTMPFFKSSAYRKALRNDYVKRDLSSNSTSSEGFPNNLITKKLDNLVNILERSFLFRYASYGFWLDCRRLTGKIKKASN